MGAGRARGRSSSCSRRARRPGKRLSSGRRRGCRGASTDELQARNPLLPGRRRGSPPADAGAVHRGGRGAAGSPVDSARGLWGLGRRLFRSISARTRLIQKPGGAQEVDGIPPPDGKSNSVHPRLGVPRRAPLARTPAPILRQPATGSPCSRTRTDGAAWQRRRRGPPSRITGHCRRQRRRGLEEVRGGRSSSTRSPKQRRS